MSAIWKTFTSLIFYTPTSAVDYYHIPTQTLKCLNFFIPVSELLRLISPGLLVKASSNWSESSDIQSETKRKYIRINQNDFNNGSCIGQNNHKNF